MAISLRSLPPVKATLCIYDQLREITLKKKTSLLSLIILMASISTISNALGMGNNDLEQNDRILDSDSYEVKLDKINRSLNENPKCSVCYFARGFVYEEAGKTFDALEDYDKAIELNPGNAKIYYYRGRLRMLQPSDRSWAIEDFNECIKLGGDIIASCYHGRGNAYSLNQNDEKALEDYASALKYGNKDATLFHNFGSSYLSLEKYDKAIESFFQAVKIDPDDDIALLNIAKIYSIQNKKSDSIKYLELALSKNGYVAKYGIHKQDHRWDNIRDTKEFQKIKDKD
jgi:tetratricopeptide (TPR) repeat protein